MPPSILALLLAGVVLNASAQLLLKAGTKAVGTFAFHWHSLLQVAPRLALEPHILGGLCCYVISLVVWIMGLSRIPVSVAYPLLSIGYVLNAVGAWWLFGETLNTQKIVGITFIILGVFILARSP